jgi:hypothetical protein
MANRWSVHAPPEARRHTSHWLAAKEGGGWQLVAVSVGEDAAAVQGKFWLLPLDAKRTDYLEMNFNHSSSVNTLTPNFFASASLEPAPGPATT